MERINLILDIREKSIGPKKINVRGTMTAGNLIMTIKDRYNLDGRYMLRPSGTRTILKEEATIDSLICVLSRSDLQALIRRNPEVGLRLLNELGNRLRQRDDELEALAFRGLPARLAALLLREGKLAATPAPDWMRMVWPWALSFLAVSGVTATRVSPTVVSAGTPISMKRLLDRLI